MRGEVIIYEKMANGMKSGNDMLMVELVVVRPE